MLDARRGRTRATNAVLPRATRHGAGAGHKRRSAGEPSPPWWTEPSGINILPFKAEIKHGESCSPTLHYPFELEITFCVRGVATAPCGVPFTAGIRFPP